MLGGGGASDPYVARMERSEIRDLSTVLQTLVALSSFRPFGKSQDKLREKSFFSANLPFLKRALKGTAYDVVTFATWEEGFLVRPGNPKGIHEAADLSEPNVRLINREEGSGARLLLDQRLRAAGLDHTQIQGYDTVLRSHFDVARAVAGHQADVGIGIRSAAQLFGLDFVPVQAARYDLVVPTAYLKSHPTLVNLFDTLVSRSFRNEIEALGGYDTRDTGKLHSLRERK